MIRKQTATLALALMLTTTAGAEAPPSQFGYSGWYYRQPTACAPESTDSHATPLPDAETTPSLPTVPTAEPVVSTVPSSAPTSDAPGTPIATATATVRPTAMPTVTSAPPVQNPSMDDDYTPDSLSAQEQKAANLLNQDRIRNGLPALTIDPELSRIARIKSEDMRDNNYFAHESPTYGKVSAMLRHFGYSFTGAGENIALHATVDKAQAAFMSSTGHRRNVLSSAWTKAGVGVCTDRNGFVYVTQIFAR